MSSLVIYNTSLCCLEAPNAPWRNAAYVIGGHQAYIHSKKDRKKERYSLNFIRFLRVVFSSQQRLNRRPLMPSRDVITTRKPGSDFDWLSV